MTLAWRRSSYCGQGECLEAAWHRSSHSAISNCLEAAHRGEVLVRDSKDPRKDTGTEPILAFPAGAWEAFTAGIKAGEL